MAERLRVCLYGLSAGVALCVSTWLLGAADPYPVLEAASSGVVVPSQAATQRQSLVHEGAAGPRLGSPQGCGPEWRIVSSPNIPGYTNQLSDVAALSSDDIWAVGTYQPDPGGQYKTLTEHWDGAQWSIVPSPNPDPQQDASLSGLVALSPGDVWAVGSSNLTLIEHWDGAQWSIVSSPNAPGSLGNFLNSAVAFSPDNIWAVGSYIGYGQPSGTLVEHWDGAQWSIVPSPSVSEAAYSLLLGIAGTSSDDIWAVGEWGEYVTQATYAFSEHWNGTGWSIYYNPNPDPGGHNHLPGVAAVSPVDVWAVGSTANHGLIEHWDGSSWTVASSPYVGGQLTKVKAVAANDIWAVGSSSDPNSPPIAEHWDGTGWTTMPVPGEGVEESLVGLSTISGADLWAVGYYNTNGIFQTLVERYSDPCAPTPTSTPALCQFNFTDVHPTDYFYQPVQYLYCHGAISGYADGSFRPYNNATRGQLSKIVVLAEGWAIDTTGGPHFSDVPRSNPFYEYIETAYNHHVISGYDDGTFRWGNDVTRGQLSKIIVVAERWVIDTSGGPHFSDVPPGNPFYGYIETAYNHSIISGYSDDTFRPGAGATRGQISKIVYNAVTQP